MKYRNKFNHVLNYTYSDAWSSFILPSYSVSWKIKNKILDTLQTSCLSNSINVNFRKFSFVDKSTCKQNSQKLQNKLFSWKLWKFHSNVFFGSIIYWYVLGNTKKSGFIFGGSTLSFYLSNKLLFYLSLNLK